MKTRILQISDLHVGKSNSESGNLRRIVDKVVQEYKNKDLVILMTGDIVDDGQKKQYKQAAKILKPLSDSPNFSVWPVPGNHDYGWNGIHARRKRFKYFKSTFWKFENVSYPHVKTDLAGNIYIGLNSMHAEADFWDGLLADGELGSKQIHNVSGVLSAFEGLPATDRKNKKVIVHLHHHPFLFPDESIIEEGIEYVGHWLKDGDGLMQTIAGRVDILLFGHEHRHLNFSGTKLSRRYRIPWILSCGKSTQNSTEYAVNDKGEADMDTALNRGKLGNMIEIGTDGGVSARTIKF